MKKTGIAEEIKAQKALDILRAENRRLLSQLDASKTKTKDLVDAVYRAARDAADQLSYTPVQVPQARDRRSDTPETAIMVVSDWQLGKKTPTYSTEVCAKRVALYSERVRRLTDIQRADRPIRKAHIFLLGDLVEGETVFPGQAHRIDASLFRQVMLDGPEILGTMIRDALAYFDEVEIHDAIGNHGRLGRRGDYHPESNSDAMLYEATRKMLGREPRLKWAPTYVPGERAWYKVVRIGEKDYFLFHGDQMRGGGFAGIPMYGFIRAMLSWASGAIPEQFQFAVCGHWHQPWSIPLTQTHDRRPRILWVNGCFPAGTPIITPEGPRAIETIAAGDTVLSRDGTTQVVKKLWRNEASSLIYLGIKGLPKELSITPNHRVWAIKGQDANCKFKRHDRPAMTVGDSEADTPRWIAAGMLSAGDWVHAPFPTSPATEVCDLDLAWVYGLFLAEGHATVDGGRLKRVCGVHFNMHQREAETHLARAKRVLDQYFGQTGHIYIRPARHTSELMYSGRANAEKWKAMFGHGAHNKFVPARFYGFTSEAKRAVVQGWLDGDGHVNRRTSVISGSTVSARLAWGMYMLAAASGMEPFIAERGSDRSHNRHFEVSLTKGQDVRWVKGERFLRICHRRHGLIIVPVYDLEVEGEHSYVAYGVGVHNSTESDNTWLQEELKAQFPPNQWLLFAHPVRGVTSEHRVWLSEGAAPRVVRRP